jgi:hypothetical protein
MNLKEYYKVRDLNPKEIKQAIDDFKNATPILRDSEKEEWSARVGDIITDRDKTFIHVYNDFMNGKIK